MARDFLHGNLTEQERILLADGGALDSGGLHLDTLVALASDPSETVRGTAAQTLSRLPDPECARLLAQSDPDGPALKYFLDSSHLRPSLLRAVLEHPGIAQSALVSLAKQASPELFSQFLDHQIG